MSMHFYNRVCKDANLCEDVSRYFTISSFIPLYNNILIVDMEIEGGGHQREGG